MKNITPRAIAILAAAVVAIFILLLLIFIDMVLDQHLYGAFIISVPFLTAVIVYFLFYYAIELFIYRRIKIIYKNIHDLKRTNQENEPLKIHNNILEEVEQEVKEWAEDRQKEIEDFQKMEKYRREYIGNVSHELKTPLFNLQGYIHTLIDGGLEDERINLDYLYKAVKNIDRLNSIVEDLEAISLLEAGEMVLDQQNFDIYKLSQEVIESLEMQSDAFDIHLGFKKGSEKPTMVRGDKEKIRQVLVNLLSNSIKYGKDNGKTLIGFYDMDKNILVEVSDDGIGIDKQHLSRVFERFYRIDKSRSRDRGGTGLGLAIVKHIIEAHNQTITVRSTKGVGSTFGFTLRKAK